jgi:hypothetical protein
LHNILVVGQFVIRETVTVQNFHLCGVSEIASVHFNSLSYSQFGMAMMCGKISV